MEVQSSGGGGVESISVTGQPLLTGDVTLTAGANITLLQVGNDINISSGVDASVTLADVSVNSTDATKSLYTMTSTIPVEFKTSDNHTLLYLDETNERVGVGTATPGFPLEVNGNAKFNRIGLGADPSATAGEWIKTPTAVIQSDNSQLSFNHNSVIAFENLAYTIYPFIIYTSASPAQRTYTLTQNAGTIGQIIQGFTSQTADLTQWQDVSNNVLLSVNKSGVFARYNNIATAGMGVPSIYGSGRATGQTAANSSVATYTVGAADGSFIISGNVLVTASTTHSFQLECAYTDEGGTARTVTFNVQQLGGTLVTSITNITGVGPYEGVPLHIRCKASTSITIRTNSGGTYTSVTYNVEGNIMQIA